MFIVDLGGASVDLKDESGLTALHKACGFGKLQSVKLLVNSGANVNDLEFMGQRPVHLASEEGKEDIVQYLLAKGAKSSVQDKDGRSPLHMCAKNGGYCFFLQFGKFDRVNSFKFFRLRFPTTPSKMDFNQSDSTLANHKRPVIMLM